MTREDVVDKISAFVRAEYRVTVDDPSADMRESLGLDSLDLTEMVFAIEEMFDVDIATNELYGCRTLNDVADVFVKKLGDRGTPRNTARRTAGA